MRPTIITYLLVTGIVLFAAITYLLYNLVYLNSTAWVGMNSTDFENGFIMVMIPFCMLGFTVALIMMIYKGWKPPGQGEQ